VLKEYREKSKEFEKATKKSRQSYNAFDKDVKALNKRIQQLELEKKRLKGEVPVAKMTAT
jgi:outer membrane murein-binding lipoprotein Lpp